MILYGIQRPRWRIPRRTRVVPPHPILMHDGKCPPAIVKCASPQSTYVYLGRIRTRRTRSFGPALRCFCLAVNGDAESFFCLSFEYFFLSHPYLLFSFSCLLCCVYRVFLVAIFNRLLSAINVLSSLPNNIFGGRLGNHYWHITVTPYVLSAGRRRNIHESGKTFHSLKTIRTDNCVCKKIADRSASAEISLMLAATSFPTVFAEFQARWFPFEKPLDKGELDCAPGLQSSTFRGSSGFLLSYGASLVYPCGASSMCAVLFDFFFFFNSRIAGMVTTSHDFSRFSRWPYYIPGNRDVGLAM